MLVKFNHRALNKEQQVAQSSTREMLLDADVEPMHSDTEAAAAAATPVRSISTRDADSASRAFCASPFMPTG
jgi:hypothetical protein